MNDIKQILNAVLAESLRDAFEDGVGPESADAKVELASIVLGFSAEQAMATLMALINRDPEAVAWAGLGATLAEAMVVGDEETLDLAAALGL